MDVGIILKLKELFELLVILISKLVGLLEKMLFWALENFAWIFEKTLQFMIDLVRFILDKI